MLVPEGEDPGEIKWEKYLHPMEEPNWLQVEGDESTMEIFW